MGNKSSKVITIRQEQQKGHAQLFFLLMIFPLVLTACDVNELSLPTSIPLPDFNGGDEQQEILPTAIPDESPRGGILIDLPPTWTPVAKLETTPVAPSAATSAATTSARTYVVQTGDTLAEIASQFDISLSILAQANNISDPDHIEVGQELVIPDQ